MKEKKQWEIDSEHDDEIQGKRLGENKDICSYCSIYFNEYSQDKIIIYRGTRLHSECNEIIKVKMNKRINIFIYLDLIAIICSIIGALI